VPPQQIRSTAAPATAQPRQQQPPATGSVLGAVAVGAPARSPSGGGSALVPVAAAGLAAAVSGGRRRRQSPQAGERPSGVRVTVSGPRVAVPRAPLPEARPLEPMHTREPGERPRSLTIDQAAAHASRLFNQTRDLSERGHGNKAARRRIELAEAKRGNLHPGLSRGGKTLSKAQQRKFFADPKLRRYAKEVARRGAAFKALPERRKPPGPGSAR
jgi:hypothetical protein